MLHPFIHKVTHLPLPEQFTYPFHYTPHPLCLIATEEVQYYIKTQKQWEQELQQGKMFGVLVVQTPDGEIGYLAAFSGNLAGKNLHSYFVPPVYDLLQPDGFFRIEEEKISAINIQHIESVNEEVQDICGIEIKERVPDSVLQEADEVVNIDLTAEELITRLKAGKIYRPDKIQVALNNFFKTENILQLRELALKEVALRVEKKVENEVVMSMGVRHEKFMACISSHEKTPRRIIRKAARLATRYNTTFVALYVQTPRESMDRIDLASQRHLLNHFKLVAELGGEVVQVQSKDVLGSIVRTCRERQITTICMGSPRLRVSNALCAVFAYKKFLANLAQANVDLIILAVE